MLNCWCIIYPVGFKRLTRWGAKLVVRVCTNYDLLFLLCCVSAVSLHNPIHSQLNWVISLCDVIHDGKLSKLAQIWQAIAQASKLSFSVVFRTENCAVHSGNPTVFSAYLSTPRCHTHKKTHRTDKKTNKPCGKTVPCRRTFSSVIRVVFLHS
jgi:hypothetical protein